MPRTRPAGGQTQIDDSFDTRDEKHLALYLRARELLARYNASPPADRELRGTILSDLLGTCGKGVWIEPPFFCDYGENIDLGAGVFLNFNCVILDGARVTIGDGTLLGPAVQIYATTHPVGADDRIYSRDGNLAYRTTARPVSIGQKVWIGGGSIIQPGVTIGDGTTIGAGSVVTKSVPARVFAAGNPCRVIRDLPG